jgi:hypothetical protein
MKPKTLGKAFAAIASAGVLYVAGSALGNYWFSQPSSVYAYHPTHGTLTYEDGTPLGESEIRLTFYPLEVASQGTLSPRAGITVPDKDGAFKSITSLRSGDGLMRAKYRVTLTTMAGQPLPGKVISRQYAKFDTSPLEVTVEGSPLAITVPRPAKKPSR